MDINYWTSDKYLLFPHYYTVASNAIQGRMAGSSDQSTPDIRDRR